MLFISTQLSAWHPINSASSYVSQDNVKNTVSLCLLIIVTLLMLGYEMV